MNKSRTVWIFQTGEPLHTDAGNPRPMRAMNLADTLVNSGHKVVIWSSSFYHQEKSQRTLDQERIKYNDWLEIVLIPSRGYRRNIGFDRLLDHAQLALNLKKALDLEKVAPDVAFVGYPPIEFAYVAVSWLNKRGIPLLLDAKDQWPHIFVEAFPRLLRSLAKLVFFPYFYLGRTTMRRATGFSTMSSGFLKWMHDFSGRLPSQQDCVVPLSAIQQKTSAKEIDVALKWWTEVGVCNDEKKKVFFIGSFSQAFDFKPIVTAATMALTMGKDWQFIICGNGDKSAQLLTQFKNLPNVLLPGWVDRSKIEALAKLSAIGLAPYRNTQDFKMSIPNKIIDYLSLGKPIISPLGGEVKALIEEKKVGVTYDEKVEGNLFTVLDEILNNDLVIQQMSMNGLATYEAEFFGEKVYSSLMDRLLALK
jgi:glycosyltransferase involved in cell wall biosynthesis